MFRKSNQGGFYLIGLLIVLVIIVYLTYDGYFARSAGQQSTYQYAMTKTQGVDCSAARTSLKTYMQMKNPSQMPATIEELYASGAPRHKCLENGVYTIGKNGEIYCSVHYPDPDQPPAPAAAAPAAPR